MRLPPSPTAPIGFIETKLEALHSRMDLRKGGKDPMAVVARDNTRDSMATIRARERERERNMLSVAGVSSYGGEGTNFCGSQMTRSSGKSHTVSIQFSWDLLRRGPH